MPVSDEIEELPVGQAWYACECDGAEGFCDHYLGMCMPYALCAHNGEIEGYVKVGSGFGKAKERKCELCVVESGVYYG
jgi:hypothetical protein